jgi:hypothetical protein
MKAKPPDYYRLLGLTPEATAQEIKRAYRRLARRYHPDANPPERKEWAEARMRLLNEAYEVLGRLRSRATYDQSRRSWWEVPLSPSRTRRSTWTYTPPPRSSNDPWVEEVFTQSEAWVRQSFRSRAKDFFTWDYIVRTERGLPPWATKTLIVVLPALIGSVFAVFLSALMTDPNSFPVLGWYFQILFPSPFDLVINFIAVTITILIGYVLFKFWYNCSR